MFGSLYEWIENLVSYLVLVSVLLHVVPGSGYKKYLQFFTGLVLILMMISPVLRWFSDEVELGDFYKSSSYQTFKEDLQHTKEQMEEKSAEWEKKYQKKEFEDEEKEIEVEEVRIGRE